MRILPLQPLGLVALLAFGAHAHAASSGLGLKLDSVLHPAPQSDKQRFPIFLDADELRGRQEQDIEGRGNVRLRTRGKSVAADWLYYDQGKDEVEAAGNVRIEQGGDIFDGTRLKLNVETDRGFMKQPKFRLMQQNARGDARDFFFEGTDHYRAERANYTTCGPGQDDWFIRAGDLDIDKSTDIGTARDASVVFLGTPILYTPWINFSLSRARKSGFLSPTIATSGKSGPEFSIPYYWNISPNRDATITPHLLARRGLLLGSEFRYLERSYQGEVRVETLPRDRVFDGSRYAAFLRHSQSWGPWGIALDLQKVSDDSYFRDLSTQVQTTSRTFLPRQGIVSRAGALGSNGVWAFSGMLQRWQTLQDPLAPITPPYDRLPQLTLSTNSYDLLGADASFTGSYVDFHHPTLVNGRRAVAYPSFAFPLQTAYAYLTPKLGVHYTRYDLDSSTTKLPDASRVVPIASAESGLVFERDTAIRGRRYLQTLEPKLYYVYIPTRNQDHLPNFDSAVSDINFATIFADNQFSGDDRINDANQLTLGASSRLLDPETGIEQLRVDLAQRYYFKGQEVTIPGMPARTRTSSDILAALSGKVAPHLIAEFGLQYNDESSQTQKFALGARYQPELGKVLNAGYRFINGGLENIDVSTQWPIARGWTGVARMNYSLRDRRIAEGLAGIEYDGGCWVFRVVGTSITVGTGDTTNSIYMQLELNGVAKVGANPLDVLRQNIAGYTKINERQGSDLPALR
jgi:LPS-assembly protein